MQALGLCGVTAGVYLGMQIADMALGMLVAMAAALSVYVAFEGIPATLRAWGDRSRDRGGGLAALRRSLVKMAGLVALLGLALAACMVLPFFRRAAPVEWIAGHRAATWVIVPLLALSFAYIWLADRLSDDPDDYLYQTGRVVLMQDFRPEAVLFGVRVLCIKLFFLVLMFSGGMESLAWFSAHGFREEALFSATWFDKCVRLIYLADVVLAAMGYVATFKLFGWHIRQTETRALGWAVCMLCYEPFFSAVSAAFVPYGDGPDWRAVIHEGSTVFLVWSVVVLTLHAIYVWATIAFGPRFSNLTHRGIISGGPYRFTKHPAYLAKNAAWWLFSMPGFIASGWADGLSRAAMLAVISGVYVLRARAEERMLRKDPVYVDYAARVAANGLLAQLKRLLGTADRRRAAQAAGAPDRRQGH
jgi:protein-S-isoprenylcysteine O-methyltransferase Ste14